MENERIAYTQSLDKISYPEEMHYHESQISSSDRVQDNSQLGSIIMGPLTPINENIIANKTQTELDEFEE